MVIKINGCDDSLWKNETYDFLKTLQGFKRIEFNSFYIDTCRKNHKKINRLVVKKIITIINHF